MRSLPAPVERGIAALLEALYWRPRLGLRAVRRVLSDVARCRVGGIEILIGIASENEHVRAETYATKEPETLNWLRENLRDDDVLFDVGANIGLYSIFAAKLRPASRVFAFEPESHNFSSLCRNLRLNGVSNVTPCSFPLSDRQAFEHLYVYDLRPGSALHSLGGPSAFRDGPESLRQGTLGVSLDALARDAQLPVPSLLKLDVDGNEEKILDGGTGLLRSGRLRSILLEATVRKGEEVSWAERKLSEFGYELTGRSEWVIEIRGLRSRNLIFNRPA
jgi:FkbM family methyltransferase